MSSPNLELPSIQNWSCHSCSGCCRQHGIAITDEEHARIVSQDWTAEDGIPSEQPLFVRMGGWFGKKWWRLAHQPDGRCVFLDDQGLCRIHGKFGEPAKPLACRIYPYAFHPKGRKAVVSLRFSCPSVVRNQGQPVDKQRKELREIAAQVVPKQISQARPPRLSDRQVVDWNDLLRVVDALDETMQATAAPITVRLLRSLARLDLLEASTLTDIKGPRLTELLDLLSTAVDGEQPDDFDVASIPAPGSLGRMLFRLLAGQYARIDSYTSGQGSLAGRWRLFTAASRLARGRGQLPELDPQLGRIPFTELESPRGPLPEAVDEILTRYFRVKLQGLHFCGRAYYGVPLIEGFRSLSLLYAATLWIARWLAVTREHDHLTVDDVADALAMADHHHGYSPALGTFGARGRVRTLHRLGDIPRLIAWYSRESG